MPACQPLLPVLAAAAAGIVLDRNCAAAALWPWLFLAASGLVFWATVTLITSRSRSPENAGSRRRDALAFVCGNVALLAAVAGAAGAWHHCRWSLFRVDDLGCFARHKAAPICLEAIAVQSPRRMPPVSPDPMQGMPREACSRLLVDVMALRNGATWQPASGRALLTVAGEEPPQITAGDRVRCFVQLSAPREPQNPGAFDAAARDRSDGILSRLYAKGPACISIIEQSSCARLTRLLDAVRSRSNRLLESYLDPRSAKMAEAVLLGDRNQLDRGCIEDFMATGVIHLLVVSGLHVGLLAGTFYWLLRRTSLPCGWAAALVSLAALFYMLLVDAGPPVVRATVLVLLACLATSLGRRPLSYNLLAAAALVILVMNPNHLFHAGAQLSFLSVAGIMWFAPRWTKYRSNPLDRLVERNLPWHEYARWAIWRSVRHLMLVSLVIWLLTMPLVMARFHLCTPVTVLLNTFVWLPMAAGLVSAAVLVAVGGLVPPLAHVCGAICNANFAALEYCVATARQVPLGHFWFPGPDDWWLWGFYGGLGLLLAFPAIRPRRRMFVGLVAAWIAVGLAVSFWRSDRDRLDCTVLSVGHGSAVVLELPSGQTLLYDAGQLGAPTFVTSTISEFLWSRGRTRIDGIVLSHPDLDHYNAVPGLLERFSVGAVYVSPLMFEKGGRAVTALHEAIERRGIPIRELSANDRLPTGDGCRVTVLHPPRHPSLRGSAVSDNANSLVLSVEAFGRRVVLPGDLESPGLDDLLAGEPKRCDVLMAPHHGSRKSNSSALAAWCRPAWVVFSGDGRWNLPDIEATYRAVGGRTLHTHLGGAIQIRITAASVEVHPFLTRPHTVRMP